MIDSHVNAGKVLDESFIHISIKNINQTIETKDQEIKRLGEQ